MQDHRTPRTLQEAIKRFADPDYCLALVVSLRWPDGIRCPHCGVGEPYFLARRRIWKCHGCRKQFSVKTGTVFEDSPLGLDKWLAAVWCIANDKNGISSYEVARALGVTQKTAWFMLHRVRKAMEIGSLEKLSGEVEADETLIGGKARFMHKGKRKVRGTGPIGKTIVMAVVERHRVKGAQTVRAKVIPDTKRTTLHPEITGNVAPGSMIYTDELPSYDGLPADYIHEAVDHSRQYVRGRCHTQNADNFWCLLKRTIRGTYVHCQPFHLNRYLAEQVFRYNERKSIDAERFEKVIGAVAGKRLTYRDLTSSGIGG